MQRDGARESRKLWWSFLRPNTCGHGRISQPQMISAKKGKERTFLVEVKLCEQKSESGFRFLLVKEEHLCVDLKHPNISSCLFC